MKRKIISLDIETANLDMKEEGITFGNPRGWKTSCACVYDAYEDKVYSFVKNPTQIKNLYKGLGDDHPVKKDIFDNLHNFESMKVFFESWFKKGYTLLTHNGISFDMPILCKTINKGGAELNKVYKKFCDSDRNIDTCAYLRGHTGYRFRLQNLIKGILGESESKLMEAVYAPSEWRNMNYIKVLSYCIGDAIYTYDVYDKVLDNGGSFVAKVKHNKKEFLQEVENVEW